MPKEQLTNFSKSLNFKFTLPVGYRTLDTIERYLPGRNILLDLFWQEIENKKYDVLIGFCIWDYARINDTGLKQHDPTYDKNKNYYYNVKSILDTSKSKINYFSKDYAAKIYGADVAGYYDFFPVNAFRDKYNLVKIIFIHKENRGDIELFYFHNEKNRENIDKYIHQTDDMIRFFSKLTY